MGTKEMFIACLPTNHSPRGGHHGDGGGRGRAEGGAAVSLGGSEPERSGRVLGAGSAVTVHLPRGRDARRRRPGVLQAVPQVQVGSRPMKRHALYR